LQRAVSFLTCRSSEGKSRIFAAMKKKHSQEAPIISEGRMSKEALFEIFADGKPADVGLMRVMKKYRLRDEKIRGRVAECVYGVIRYLRPLMAATGCSDPTDENQLAVLVHAWKVFAFRHSSTKIKTDEEKRWADRFAKYKGVRKIRESIPDWLDERGLKEIGESDWENVLQALNRKPEIAIRANTLVTTREKLKARLAAVGIETEEDELAPDALRLPSYANVFVTEAFEAGEFEVQDVSSQRIAPLLDVKAGMRVVDACAGRGGKTLHLAALMQNKGRLLALDVSETKLQELRKRVRRASVAIAEAKTIDSQKVIKRLAESADRLLLDLPCSGLGVLRRNPDIRWRLQPEELEELIVLQYTLLVQYAALVKPGGKLVFATCSILPSEGEWQTKKFIEEHGTSWSFDEELRISPANFDGDGFYAAVFTKKI
jgi:16S rRNA (cytosine967-C5)-methyltransferase